MAQILYFAWLREKIGHDGDEIDVRGEASAASLAATLAARGGGYAEALGDPARIRVAIDQTMATLDAPVADAREIAFFPPVTGG